MKKSFSIIEVLISVLLLSGVMMTLLQTRDNNMFMLTNFYDKSKSNGYLSVASTVLNEGSFYISDKLTEIKDDDIRKEFKEIKYELKIKELDKQNVEFGEMQLKFIINQEQYKNEKYGGKVFARVSLE